MRAVDAWALLARLEARGFDKVSESDGEVSVGCSQCEAVCINGVACHEQGCPNEARAKREAAREDAEEE